MQRYEIKANSWIKGVLTKNLWCWEDWGSGKGIQKGQTIEIIENLTTSIINSVVINIGCKVTQHQVMITYYTHCSYDQKKYLIMWKIGWPKK